MGTSSSRYACCVSLWDHPHACGDKDINKLCTVGADGSSPRVWGQAHMMSWYTFVDRIIPTRVGTSPAGQTRLVSHRDHPHAFNDTSCSEISSPIYSGSSPRVWGQGVMAVLSVDEYRIIPTRVGTSRPRPALLQGVGDHPHACGDKAILGVNLTALIGSSPRVWGQGRVNIQICTDIRIIPTRVGTSPRHRRCTLERGDHPHACGDKYDNSY